MSARLRLPPATFAALREAHAWAGVLSSLVLFVLFFLGAFAMFWEHLGPWQEPRLRSETAATERQVLAAAQRDLEERLAARPSWLAIALPHAGEPWLHIRELLPSGDEKIERVHPVTGERASPTSELGYFLYEMHFLDALPGGMQIAGAASGVMVSSS